MEIGATIRIPLLQVCSDLGQDPKLMIAIFYAESALDPFAVRFEPAFRSTWEIESNAAESLVSRETERICQHISWGLGQILGATARRLGFRKKLTHLLNVEPNIYWSTVLVKQLTERFGVRDDVIAAYNAGRPNKTGDVYVNQAYVDKVNEAYRKVVV